MQKIKVFFVVFIETNLDRHWKYTKHGEQLK